MNLPDIPKYVADYFNFVIDFVISPKKALEFYKAKDSIHETLISFTAIGIFFTWINGTLLQKLGEINHDKSDILKFIPKIDIDMLPLVALLTVTFAAVIFHLILKLVLMFELNEFKKPEGRTRATSLLNLKNTINGALAFFSVIPFLLTLCFLLTMLGAYNLILDKPSPVTIILLELPLIAAGFAAMIWYFPQSLSQVQPAGLTKTVNASIYSVFGVLILFFLLLSKT
jgi:hypothetical protein